MENWYSDSQTVLDFGKILHDAQLLTAEKLADYYSSPRTYDAIYSLWVEYGKPMRNDPTWSDWIEESSAVAA